MRHHPRRWFAPLATLLLLAACKTGAGEAEQFADNYVHNYCYILKKCFKFAWNEQEYDNIEDCEDDQIDDDYGPSEFADDCEGYDEDMGKDCLQQLVSEYNSCSPEHDCDDADYDPEDNPCTVANLCPDGYNGPPLFFGCI